MEDRDKKNIKLKFGLSIQKVLDRNKDLSLSKGESSQDDDDILIKTYGRLATLSGIPKASVIRIVSGKINMASSTLGVIIETLGLTLSEFGQYYDSISDKDIQEYDKKLSLKHRESVQKSRNQALKKKRSFK
jgi:hypothetical protein